MKYYDLTVDAPFEPKDIPAPEQLNGKEDIALLMQHCVAKYSNFINFYYVTRGYEDRQRMLCGILQCLIRMSQIEPAKVANYPESLPDIYEFFLSLIFTADDVIQDHKEPGLLS